MTPAFPRSIFDYWQRMLADDRPDNGAKRPFTINARLDPTRPAMILETADGPVRAVVRPELAERIGRGAPAASSIGTLRDRLADIGVTLHDPDYLFYVPDYGHGTTVGNSCVRRLTEGDRRAFTTFYFAADEQDRDDAGVEFDHWAVFGYFFDGHVVCAASAILWDDGPIADLGILTLPGFRRKGFANAVVAAIVDFSRRHGKEPQYRCQVDNRASIALARASGLSLFGRWTVAASSSPLHT